MEITCDELNITSSDIEEERDIEKLKYYIRNIILISGNIKSQIEEYKVNYVEKGISGDYEWLKSAKYKSRLYAFFTEAIKSRITHLKKQKKERKLEVEKNIRYILEKNSSTDIFNLEKANNQLLGLFRNNT